MNRILLVLVAVLVVGRVAALRGMAAAELAAQVARNFDALFGALH